MMEAMQKALEVPHMTFCDEVNADLLGHVRSDLKEAAERRGSRLSYMPLIVKVGLKSAKATDRMTCTCVHTLLKALPVAAGAFGEEAVSIKLVMICVVA